MVAGLLQTSARDPVLVGWSIFSFIPPQSKRLWSCGRMPFGALGRAPTALSGPGIASPVGASAMPEADRTRENQGRTCIPSSVFFIASQKEESIRNLIHRTPFDKARHCSFVVSKADKITLRQTIAYTVWAKR